MRQTAWSYLLLVIRYSFQRIDPSMCITFFATDSNPIGYAFN
jgi:hypothetical protein